MIDNPHHYTASERAADRELFRKVEEMTRKVEETMRLFQRGQREQNMELIVRDNISSEVCELWRLSITTANRALTFFENREKKQVNEINEALAAGVTKLENVSKP